MSIELADILRKLFIGQASVLLIMAVWTIVRYARKQRTAPKNDKALPTHVALVAVSYVVFILYICFDLYDRLGLPATWRLPLALVGSVLGCAAQAFMVSHLSVRRYLRARIDREADKVAAEALVIKNAVHERRMDRMEEVGRETHDAVQEIQHDAGVAKETAKDVSDKADSIGEIGSDTNVRVRKLERSNGK